MELLKAPMRDRDYYRACTNTQLVEEARYNINIELAMVLGERLEAANAELERHTETYRMQLDVMEARVEDLEGQVAQLSDDLDEQRSEA